MGHTLGIVAKPRLEAVELAVAVARWAGDHKHRVVADPRTAENLADVAAVGPAALKDADLVVVIGGDGTLIHAAQMLEGRKVPIFGINVGTLGFLTEITRAADIYGLLADSLEGHTAVEERMLLKVEARRGGRSYFQGLVLNDAVVNKAALARIAELACYIDGREATRYRADGLIVATPTGSTAYNLAAGGPILYPTLRSLLLSPICPHTLTQRPLVLPASAEVRLVLVSDNGEMFLTLDGQRGTALHTGDEIVVRESRRRVYLVRSPEVDFFSILRQKLHWG